MSNGHNKTKPLPGISRFKSAMLAKNAPNWPWIVVFVAMALVVMFVSLKVPHQTAEQEFYFRIIVALAAAGIGAIIPGFFQVRIHWLKNAVHAGGAIGLFVLIYMHNPPRLSDRPAPPPIPDISGEWFYECDANDKEYKHGGVCTLKARLAEYGIIFEIAGTRKWRQLDKLPREELVWNWRSSWGMITEPNKFRFEYNVEKPDGIVHGFAWGDIVCDNGQPVSLEGNFYQVPPTDPLFGHMVFTKKRVGSPASKGMAP